MLIKLGKFLKSKQEWDSENIICPVKTYNRIRYLNIRMVIRVVLSLPFFFFLGIKFAEIGTTLRSIFDYGIRFCLYYIALFYIFQIIHVLTHLLFLPHPFSKRNTLLFFNKKRLVTYSLQNKYNPFILSLSLSIPLICYTIIPIILIIFWKYDLILFTLALANLILSSDDILNFFLLLIYCDLSEKQSLYPLNNILTVDNSPIIDSTITVDTNLIADDTTITDTTLTLDTEVKKEDAN